MKISKSRVIHWSTSHARWLLSGSLLLAAVAVGVWWSLRASPSRPGRNETSAPPALKIDFDVVQPLPEQLPLNTQKVALGEQLFHDVRLSGNDTLGCFSCHDLHTAGVDNRVHSTGVNGTLGDINAPTVFNSGFNFVQFWDGRVATLEEQIDAPVNNPKELASSWTQITGKLSKDTHYAAQFSSLYRDGITPANIRDAIATFERSLLTPNSRFDKYLRGDQTALSAKEKNGFELFQSYGCSSCHQGVNLGGNMFEKMGLMGDYFADRGNPTEADQGRIKHTKIDHHLHEFKVPGLRNVARTAPYFHDGNAATLKEAVIIMAKYQLGRPMPAADVEAIVAFLQSLTGEYKGAPL